MPSIGALERFAAWTLPMLFPFSAAMMLAIEAYGVIGLRLMKFWNGDPDALSEAHLMVSEKVAANLEAGLTLMTGGSATTIIGRYREHVAANSERLSARPVRAARETCSCPV